MLRCPNTNCAVKPLFFCAFEKSLSVGREWKTKGSTRRREVGEVRGERKERYRGREALSWRSN